MDKGKVDNIEVLNAAEEKYYSILKEEVEDAIDQIGEVSLERESAVQTARIAYARVGDTVRKSISNYEVLVQAEEELSDLKVQQVSDHLAEINVDKITLDDSETVASMESEFNRLTADERQRVENSEVLTEAKAKIADLKAAEQEKQKAEKEKELNSALSKLQKEEDKVENITYYRPSTFPKYINSRTYALPYMGVKGSNVWLRIKFVYYGSSWINWENITVAADDYRYTKSYGYFDVNKDVDNAGNVVEYIDIPVETLELELLRKMSEADETIIRFQGDYKKDLTLSGKDRKAIGELLEAYRLLKAG